MARSKKISVDRRGFLKGAAAGAAGAAAALVARIQQVGWNAMVHQADVSDAEANDASFDRHVAINLKGVFSGLRDASKRIELEDLLSPRMN